eukprot:11408151-Ditylum_brightwellii.AAC.1
MKARKPQVKADDLFPNQKMKTRKPQVKLPCAKVTPKVGRKWGKPIKQEAEGRTTAVMSQTRQLRK